MTESVINPALRFETDAYDMKGALLMGRQAAGHGFLRALLAAERKGPLVGYGPNEATGKTFADLVARLDPSATTDWVLTTAFDRFNALGVCHRPDPDLSRDARLRLRVGPARHCLTGVTHTLSTARSLEGIASLLSAPLMPWDALICTSKAAVDVVESIWGEQADYLRWRFGTGIRLERPQLSVIPLGVHAGDYETTPQDRARARAALAVADDEVVALYAGRLSFVDKAHPLPMLTAAQAAAERTGKRLVLVQAGRFAAPFIETAMRAAVTQFCPGVRCLFVDGDDFAAYQDAWAAADLFVSMADSLQETFGLTPLEAMAAGLPCLVSDWNGYRETVRDGVDGFRVPTWTPGAGAGEELARDYEAEVINDGLWAWGGAGAVAVDQAVLADRLSLLAESPDLRRRMGEAGRARVREAFDWPGLLRRYQALWRELNARRLAVAGDAARLAMVTSAPRAVGGRGDPFETFDHYPTHRITADTPLRLAPGVTVERYREVLNGGFFGNNRVRPPRGTDLVWVLQQRTPAAGTVGELATAIRMSLRTATLTVAILAKMGMVRLGET